MDPLDRLFRHLVYLLADQDFERLHAPFEVAELYQQILPYRQHRAALGVDTNQDYEMALLRLLSGDRGYAIVEPSEVQEALRQEAEAINPDTGAFREYAAARVRLSAAAVRAALEARGAYAPAPESANPEVKRGVGSGKGDRPEDRAVPLPTPFRIGRQPEPRDADQCPYCGQDLPTQRVVFYCPFCGGNVRGVECPKCGTGLEMGWSFCITCGHKVGRS